MGKVANSKRRKSQKAPPVPEGAWLPVSTVARLLKVAYPTVHSMIARKELRADVFGGRVLVMREDVEAKAETEPA